MEKIELDAKFASRVDAFGKSSDGLATRLRALVESAVRSAYSRNNLLNGQYLIDNAPQFAKASIARSFKRCGLEVASPERGSARYTLVCVVDAKRQGKVFNSFSELVVLEIEDKVRPVAKPKELKGEVAERATKALQSTITRLAKSDAEASALLNDRMTSGNQVNVLIDGKGTKYVLDAETVQDIVAQLLAQ